MLNHDERGDAEAVLVVPEWTYRPFWRRIESGAWRQRVVLDLYLEPGVIEANPETEEHCFFGSALFDCRLRVMRTKKLGGAIENIVAGADFSACSEVAPPTLAGGDPPPGAKRNRAPRLGRHLRRKLARDRASGAAPEPPAL